MKRIALALVLVSITLAIPSQKELNEIASAYQEAFNTGNSDVLSPYLSEDFTFMGQPSDISRIVLESVLGAKALHIDDIIEVGAEEKEGELILNMKVKIQGGIESNDMVKLVESDGRYLISEMGQGMMQPMVIQDPVSDIGITVTGREHTFIEMYENPTHILIPVQIGDTTHTFILDSGAPMTIISSQYAGLFETFGGQALVSEAKGIGGDIGSAMGNLVVIDAMDMGGMVFEGIKAMTMDLEHLEKALERPFTGLIGADIIGRVLVTVDYNGGLLYLDTYEAKPGSHLSEVPAMVLPFERTLHLVMVEGKLPGIDATIKFTLDSGAGAGLISDEIFSKIPAEYIEEGDADTLMGAGKQISVTQTKFLKPLTVGGVTRDDYPGISSDLSVLAIGEEKLIDGLIGLNFFEDYLITLNYKEEQIELRNLQKE